MAWRTEMVRIVRALINDLSDPYTYCDSRVEELIVIAAQLTKNEVDFATTYTINIGTMSISPDPTTDRDDAFISLVSLKAACLILSGEAKLASANNVKIVDAGAQVDFSGAADTASKIASTACKNYEQGKLAYMLGNLNGIKAILTPYTSPNAEGGIYFS